MVKSTGRAKLKARREGLFVMLCKKQGSVSIEYRRSHPCQIRNVELIRCGFGHFCRAETAYGCEASTIARTPYSRKKTFHRVLIQPAASADDVRVIIACFQRNICCRRHKHAEACFCKSLSKAGCLRSAADQKDHTMYPRGIVKKSSDNELSR